MKILHIISGTSVGGAEMMLSKLVASLREKNVRSEVVSLTTIGPIGQQMRERGVKVTAINMAHGQNYFGAICRLVKVLAATDADLIQCWMYHADLIGGIAARCLVKTPVFWGIRGSVPTLERIKPTTRLAIRCSALMSDIVPSLIISCSKAAMHEHAELGYAREKMTVVPNGFDVARFSRNDGARSEIRSELALPSDALVIGTVARYDPQKDFPTLVTACGRVATALDNAHFVLCGQGLDWKNAELCSLIRATGHEGRFRLLGRRSDINLVVNSFDLGLLSSAYGEGFPNAVGEMMASEVPCVVTDVGDSGYVVDAPTQVVPSRDPVALAQAALRLAQLAPEARRELGAKARRRVVTYFEIGAVTNRFLGLYAQAVKAKWNNQMI